MPEESRTKPAMLPDSLAGPAGNAVAADNTNAANTPTASFDRPIIIPCGPPGDERMAHLPLYYFTVKLAVGVSTWLRFLSTTFIFNVYSPGTSESSGNSFSTVTCCEEAPGIDIMSSV